MDELKKELSENQVSVGIDYIDERVWLYFKNLLKIIKLFQKRFEKEIKGMLSFRMKHDHRLNARIENRNHELDLMINLNKVII